MTTNYLDSKRISVLSSSCLVRFTLDESSGNPTNHATTANGFPLGTGSTNDGTNGSSGATQNVTGKFDKCFEFDGGNNKQVNIGTVLSGTGDFSISLWINLTSNNTGYPSVVSNYGGSNTGGYQFILWGANTISFHTSGSVIHGSTVMSASAWHHVVVTRTSGVLNLYVNGSSDATAVANTHNIITSLSDAIGGKSDGTSGFNGKIDEVTFHNKGLTLSEVSSLYNSGTGKVTEGRPTNVQDNSILVEKDTGKRFWFTKGTAVTEETLDSTNGTTSWNVSNGGSDITIDTGNNEIDITGTGQKSGYYDLGASVSASAWTLRFKIASSGSPTGNPLFWVGLFDVNTIDSRNTNVDGISLMMYTGSNYLLSMKNGTHMDSGGTQTLTSPTVSADTTTRYVEIVRDGSNAILTFYDSDTYTTSIGTCTVAITGTSFQYLCAASYFEGSGRTYSLSNVKFYNGVTSVTPTAWTKGHVNPIWTVDQNFSSSTGWTKTPSSTSYWSIATDRLNWDTRIASTGQGYNYDLTTGQSVSDLDSYDEWLLRFEMVVTGGTNLNNDCLTTFGISSNNDFTSGVNGQYSSSRSHILLQCAVLDPNGNTRTLQMKAENGTSMGQQQTPNIAFSDNTTYYVEIKKTDATSYTVSWTANSDYVTSTNSKDFTGLTLTGLKYLHTESWLQGSQTQYESRSDGYIDNLKFYAGVSSL